MKILITERQLELIINSQSKKTTKVLTKEQLMNYARRKDDIFDKSKLKYGSTPFKNGKEGDAFRNYVNDEWPNIAKGIDLDRSQPQLYNNVYIQFAYNYKVGDRTLGERFMENKNQNVQQYSYSWNPGTSEVPKDKTAQVKNSDGTNVVIPSVTSKVEIDFDPTLLKLGSTPFYNKTDGDKFREWVNTNYKNIADGIKLSKSGEPNNEYIQYAWNYLNKLKNKTLGTLYKEQIYNEYLLKGPHDSKATSEYEKFSQSEPDELKTKAKEKRAIELNPETPSFGFSANGDRINKEVFYIKSNNKNKGKPFLVVDPLLNIVAAYTADYNLIDYSETVKGADPESLKPHTYEDWCKDSGKYGGKGPTVIYKGHCILKGTEKEYDKGNKISGLDYGALITAKRRQASPGVYQSRLAPGVDHYTNSGLPDELTLVTMGGEDLPNAIHGLADWLPGRLEFDANLKNLLQKEKDFGNIPNEYLDEVNKMLEEKKYGLSSGCYNVSHKFITNSGVQEILKQKPYVFVMSQERDYYLVRMDDKQGAKFFNKLNADPNVCQDPASLAKEFGQQIDPMG